jgi:hypothetical protein
MTAAPGDLATAVNAPSSVLAAARGASAAAQHDQHRQQDQRSASQRPNGTLDRQPYSGPKRRIPRFGQILAIAAAVGLVGFLVALITAIVTAGGS